MANEFLENQIYKKYINDKLISEESNFCSFRKEKQVDYILDRLKNDFTKKNLEVLDLCCGYGRLLHFLNEFDNQQNYTGIDYTETLIEKGQEMFKDHSNISFEVGNAYEISKKYPKKFDISVLHKTLSWLPYYKEIMPELIKVTKNKIYLTSLFSIDDIDFLCRVYESPGDTDSSYLCMNTYSLPTFSAFCLANGAKEVKSFPMKIDVDLEKPKGKLGTHTVKTLDGSRLEFTGAVHLNWMLIEIVLN